MDRNRRQALLAWVFVATLVVLLLVLGVLQYHWTGEVSVAERSRMRETLNASLRRLSANFNSEIMSVATVLVTDLPEGEDRTLEREFADRYRRIKTGTYSQWVRSLSIASTTPDGRAVLRQLDGRGRDFVKIDWPAEWLGIRERLERRGPGSGRPDGPFGGMATATVVEIPIFRPNGPGMPGPPDIRVLLLDFDFDYLANTVLPKMMELHLGATEAGNYHTIIIQRGEPQKILYRSDREHATPLMKADATVRTFEVRMDPTFRFRERPPEPPTGGPGGPDFRRRREFRDPPHNSEPRRQPPPDAQSAFQPTFERGRMELRLQHRAGSLEVLVARARTRNLAIIGGILALILAAGWVLLQFTRRIQRLADLQMQFVASVSHELRTPLAVMRTAGHNLQGKVALDPARVKQYGALIQQESQKLGAMVEQVLRFANSNAGRVINARQAVMPGELIEAALRSSGDELKASGCTVETSVSPDLPPVNVDRATIEHVLQNLLSNAAKYGKAGQWIGVSAELRANGRGPEVEIRVKDRGQGIAAGELEHIFDPFFRGAKAVDDQIHGTGLGLTLSRRIVEAHGGTITAASQPGEGTEFTVLLPVGDMSQSEIHATNSAS